MLFIKLIKAIKLALKEGNQDFTNGSIKKAIFLLAVPMILEMVMESLFAVVDIFFVGKIGIHAVATVGLTESVITLIYSVAIGLSMAGTALVARRVGERNFEAGSRAAFQVIFLGIMVAAITGIIGFVFAEDMLRLMGAEDEVVTEGYKYTRIIFAGNVGIMLLFLINGIFRGAGNATIAMRSLWLANGINMVLDPLLIFGLGFIPALGLEGAAIATTTGRLIGVFYQIYHLFKSDIPIKIEVRYMVVNVKTMLNIIKISAGGMGQFLIESASWIFLMRLVSEFGSVALAGYTIAVRIVIFTLLPAWGLSNAAATLVGQNLGAKKIERAETSVWEIAKYNGIFLGVVSVLFFLAGSWFVELFTTEAEVIKVGITALQVFCLGYIFFAIGMVITQAFNGAGDTKTPSLINIITFWLIQIPLSYVLAVNFGLEEMGVFISVAVSHSIHAVIAVLIFRKGKWKVIKV